MTMRAVSRVMAGMMLTASVVTMPGTGFAQSRPDQKAFFGLYKELVETNTTLSAGSCTQAAAQIGARLKSAGYADADITYFSVPEHPKDGGLVEAKREDWVRDPFKLIEEGGYYYARGTVDDKAQAAIWSDAMIRFKTGGY